MKSSECFNSGGKFSGRCIQSEKKIFKMEPPQCLLTSLSEKKTKERIKALPVRITELLEPSEKIKKSASKSVQKRLPERLHPVERNGKHDKCNEKQYPTGTARRKLNLTVTPKQFTQVKANLNSFMTNSNVNFHNRDNETLLVNNNASQCSPTASTYKSYQPVNSKAKNYTGLGNTDTMLNGSNNRQSLQPKRKSLLIPPNTVKNKYLLNEGLKRRSGLRSKKSMVASASKTCTDIFEESTDINYLNGSNIAEVGTSAKFKGTHKHSVTKNMMYLTNDNGSEDSNVLTLKENGKDNCRSNDIKLERPTVIIEPKILQTCTAEGPCFLESIVDDEESESGKNHQEDVSHFHAECITSETGDCEENHTKRNKINITLLSKKLNFKSANYSTNNMFSDLNTEKNDILYLKTTLQCLISRTEEDLKNLKGMLKCVEKMIHCKCSEMNTPNSKKDLSELSEIEQQKVFLTNEGSKEEITPQKGATERANVEKDIRLDVCNHQEMYDERKIIEGSNDVADQKFNVINHCEDEKENCNAGSISGSEKQENSHSSARRRSARLQKLQACNDQDDSFVNLEGKLNIVHAKPLSSTTNCALTPAKNNFKWQEKSLREYMLLKSSMSFLETPDAKQFQTRVNHGDDTAATNNMKTCISKKLLSELQDLCTESPM